MDVINKLASQLRSSWNSSSGIGRGMTIAAVLALLLTILGTAYWSSRPDFKLLRDGISPVMTAEIVSMLDASGIPNEMNYSGTGVKVPTSRWNDANVAISSLGIPEESPGSSNNHLFSGKPGHQSMLRTKELAIKRSLESLRAIKSAEVHIAMAEPSPFRSKQQAVSASVIVDLNANQAISQEFGASITRMVASAVEGLEPQNVTLANAEGMLMGGSADNDPAANRHKYVRDLETSLAMKAQDLLAAVLGPNKSVVRVTADLDEYLDKVVTTNKIDADSKVRLMEKITISDQQGMSRNPIGPAGTSSNGQGATASNANGTPMKGKEETNETTYDYPRTVEKTHVFGGKVLRLSVSATVDVTTPNADPAAAGADPAGNAILTQEQVESIVKTAVGFDGKRGDQIQIALSEFPDVSIDTSTVPDNKKWEFMSDLARNASLGLAAVVALLVGLLTIKKLQPIEVSSGGSGNRIRELQSQLSTRVDEHPEEISRMLAAWLDNEANANVKKEPLSKAA